MQAGIAELDFVGEDDDHPDDGCDEGCAEDGAEPGVDEGFEAEGDAEVAVAAVGQDEARAEEGTRGTWLT